MPIQQWEYHAEEQSFILAKNVKEWLNELGKEGWEIVTVTMIRTGINTCLVVFKRPAQD